MLYSSEAACQAVISRVESVLPDKQCAEWKRVKARLLAWQGLFSRVLWHIQVARQALEDALSLLDNPALVGQDTRSERAFVWQRFGDFYFDADYEQAQRCWQQSLELYRQVDDHWRLAQVLAGLGSIMEHFDAYTEANNVYMESLDIRRSLGDLSGVADTLWEIAGTIGSPEEALERYRESLAICRELGKAYPSPLHGHLR